MKRTITIIGCIGLLLASCKEPQSPAPQVQTIEAQPPAGQKFEYGPIDEYHIQEIDGCEYILVNGLRNKDVALTHKGNCKACEERHRALLIEVLAK